MTRGWLASDLDLDAGGSVPPAPEEGVLVLAGDLAVRGSPHWKALAEAYRGRTVLWVPGNRDYHGAPRRPAKTDPDLAREAARRGWTLLQRRTWPDEDGPPAPGNVRLAGCTLWTDFALGGDAEGNMERAAGTQSDYRWIGGWGERWTPEEASAEHERGLEWLTEAAEECRVRGEELVVVTHHAPSAGSLRGDGEDAACRASDLEEWVREWAPVAWLHGSVEGPVDYRIGPTRVMASPGGWAEVRLEGGAT